MFWNETIATVLPVDVAADVYLGLTHNYSSITFSTDLSLSPSNNCGRRQFHLSKPNIWHHPCRLNSKAFHFPSFYYNIFSFFCRCPMACSICWSSRQRKHRVFLDDGTYITQKVYPWSMRSVMWWFWTCPVRANTLVVVKRLKMPLSLK